MAKITELPVEAALTGAELVPIVVDDEMKTARMDDLAAAGVAPSVAEANAARDAALSARDDLFPGWSSAKYAGGWADAELNIIVGITDKGEVDFLPAPDLVTRLHGALSVPTIADPAFTNVDYVSGATDDAGNIVFGITREGEVDLAPGRETLAAIAAAFQVGDDRRIAATPAVVLDETGAEITVTAPGNVSGAHHLTPDLVRFLADGEDRPRYYLQRTDIASQTAMAEAAGPIEYVAHAGQSLSIGGAANAVIHAEAPEPGFALAFNTGTRGLQAVAVDPATLTDFAPAAEVVGGISGGETPGTGLMAWLHRADFLAGERLKTHLYRSHGAGGTAIAGLVKGTTPYANGLAEFTKAQTIAAAYGRTIAARVIHVSQGEADRTDGTSQADYVAAAVQWLADYRADWGALNPAGTGDIAMMFDQLPAPAWSGAVAGSEISLAHLQLARDHSGFYLAGPRYHLPPIDDLHLTALGYALLGEYHARARRTLLASGDWVALGQHVTITRTGAEITIDYFRDAAKTLPWSDLVIDTDTLPEAADLGFAYSGAAITGVSLAGNRITITLAADAPGDLSFAFDGTGASPFYGAWGNLRDNSTDRSRVKPGAFLWNWAVSFKEPIA